MRLLWDLVATIYIYVLLTIIIIIAGTVFVLKEVKEKVKKLGK